MAFLEQEPSLHAALAEPDQAQICLPFFAMAGDHVRRDVSTALNTGGFLGDLLPVISQFNGASQIIASAIRAA